MSFARSFGEGDSSEWRSVKFEDTENLHFPFTGLQDSLEERRISCLSVSARICILRPRGLSYANEKVYL